MMAPVLLKNGGLLHLLIQGAQSLGRWGAVNGWFQKSGHVCIQAGCWCRCSYGGSGTTRCWAGGGLG